VGENLILEGDWEKHLRESEAIGLHCQKKWPKILVRGPGCNSLGNRTWTAISKEDALEEQRTLGERIARHRIGEHKDGHFSRASSIYITSRYACQEWNLPLFPDHEANMGGLDGQRYSVQVMDPRLSYLAEKNPEFTWLSMGLTPALMQMNPPGFVSGPSQSSKVTYTQPRDEACTQSRMRLLLSITPALIRMNTPGFVSAPSQSSEVTYTQPFKGARRSTRHSGGKEV